MLTYALICSFTDEQFYIIQVIQMNIDESMRKHIAQELRINQSSQCPYVVICYQSFFDNGAISLILEYMDGGSLADFLKKVKTIPERFLAVICKQVASEQFKYHRRRICSSTNVSTVFLHQLGSQRLVVSSS